MSNRGHSQEAQFPKGIMLKTFQYEMRAMFTKSLVHETSFNTVVYGNNEIEIHLVVCVHNHAYLENVKLESTEILEIRFFSLYLLIHAIKRCC